MSESNLNNVSVASRMAWSLADLARELSVSVPFLRLELKRGRLKGARLGRRVVILDEEVRRYLAAAVDHSRDEKRS